MRQCGEEFAGVRVQLGRRDNNAGIEEAHVITPDFLILLPIITITKYPAAEARFVSSFSFSSFCFFVEMTTPGIEGRETCNTVKV